MKNQAGYVSSKLLMNDPSGNATFVSVPKMKENKTYNIHTKYTLCIFYLFSNKKKKKKRYAIDGEKDVTDLHESQQWVYIYQWIDIRIIIVYTYAYAKMS